MFKSISFVVITFCYLLQVSNYSCINASSSSVFNDTNSTIDHLLTIMSTFSDVVIATYKDSMPDVANVMQDDIHELLDNIWSSTDNKRAVNNTRNRYDEFIRDAQKSIDASIKIIRTSFDDIQSSLGDTSVKLFETATTLEKGLREKGCQDEDIVEFFKPYVNGTIECVQKAIKVEDHYRSNAETVGDAVQTVLKSVVTSLKLCTNKGSRVVFCAQRNSLALNNRLYDIKRLTERQFSRVEKQNLQQSFQEGRTCIKNILDAGEKSLKDIKCESKTVEEESEQSITVEEEIAKDLQALRLLINSENIVKDDTEPVLDEELMEYFDD